MASLLAMMNRIYVTFQSTRLRKFHCALSAVEGFQVHMALIMHDQACALREGLEALNCAFAWFLGSEDILTLEMSVSLTWIFTVLYFKLLERVAG